MILCLERLLMLALPIEVLTQIFRNYDAEKQLITARDNVFHFKAHYHFLLFDLGHKCST
jgi:hypothetical protein